MMKLALALPALWLDATDQGSDGEDPTDDAHIAGAVAETNLPSAIGCGDESGPEGSDD